MPKKTVRDVAVEGKRVLVRVDFNVPLKEGKVAEDSRLKAALPTIQYLCAQGARVILVSHLGRPKGKPDDGLRLDPVAARLGELLGRPVRKADDCVGPAVEEAVAALAPGEALLLENIRFHPGEAENDPELAHQLAALCDLYVNDAFGTAHRAHASIAVVTEHFKERVAGFLMEKEIMYLDNAISNPKRPFLAILGGAKISGKIDVLTNLIGKVDSIIVGGGMVYTFYKAMGYPVGASLVEEDRIEMAKDILVRIKQSGVKFLLPTDHIVADSFSESANHKIVGEKEIPDGWMALDIGPKSRGMFAKEIATAKTILWNGPMGCFEMAPFAEGTMAIVRAIVANKDCISIVGGGDSVSAVNQSGMANEITHISTGGGASLEFLEGKELPGISALDNA